MYQDEEGVYFVGKCTDRYLFSDGMQVDETIRGSEGWWKESSGLEAPDIKGTDDIYSSRGFLKNC